MGDPGAVEYAQTWLTLWLTVLRVVIALEATGAVAWYVKYFRDRLRWRRFRQYARQLQGFVDRLPDVEHPKLLDEVGWKAAVEEMLGDAGFSPFETADLISIAVPTAKALAPRVMEYD